MDFWKGAIMKPADVFELTGQTVLPEIFSVHPTGNMIFVLPEEVPENYGHITIPDHLRGLERMGIGYIIAVGPKAGSPDYATPGPSPVGVIVGDIKSGPEDLLSLHVIFNSHRGTPLRLDIMDREFRAQVLMMSSKDILGVDENSKALSERAMERSKG